MNNADCSCNKSNADFFAGIIIGGLIGATLALVFTPYTGGKTRKIIEREGKKAFKKAMSTMDEFGKQNVNPVIEDVETKIDDRFKRAKKEINERAKKLKRTSKNKESKS